MHRTMIYIDDQDYQVLKKKASLGGNSLSELIREAIHHYLDKVTKRPSWQKDPVWNLGGQGSALEDNQDSLEHDKILYGDS